MTTQEAALKVRALRRLTQETGMITKRSQNQILAQLSDEQLAEVAVLISNEGNERNGNLNIK